MTNTLSEEDPTTKIFNTIIDNWSVICQNDQIMVGLNMETNSLCRSFKQQNPSHKDQYIQQQVLTIMIMIWINIAMPGTVTDTVASTVASTVAGTVTNVYVEYNDSESDSKHNMDDG